MLWEPIGRIPNVKIMPNDGILDDLIPLYAPDPTVPYKLLVTS